MNNSLKWPRILVVLASVMLVGAIFLPIWRIELSAPQYPEGLILKIGADGLTGDVDIINGLNHYIGMRTMHSDDFIEFTLLPYIFGSLVFLGLVAAFVNKKKLYYFYIALFMLVAIASMVDFYMWEYDYGHNLDPNAAIKVPGMSYQPPLIGYKQLLNFGAYSIPDAGGWLFIGAAVLLFAAYLLILQPKWLPFGKTKVIPVALLMLILQSCSSGPVPINYGKDACDFCKMTIMDKRFGSEWVTTKGKAYRFDDVHCLLNFRKADKSDGTAYINDFAGTTKLYPAEELVFVKSQELRTPMGGKVAAFTDKSGADKFLSSDNGAILSWQEVEQSLMKHK